MADLSRRRLLSSSAAVAITAALPAAKIRLHPSVIGLSPIAYARRSLGLDQHWRFGFMTPAEVRALEELPPL